MPKAPWLVAVAILATGLVGCADMSPPNFFSRTPARYQQLRAQRFDPYADPDIGPAVVGARPREYQVPVAEPQRARWNRRLPGAAPAVPAVQPYPG